MHANKSEVSIHGCTRKTLSVPIKTMCASATNLKLSLPDPASKLKILRETY